MYITSNTDVEEVFQDTRTCRVLVTDCSRKAGKAAADRTTEVDRQDDNTEVVSDPAFKSGGQDSAPEATSHEVHSKECCEETDLDGVQNKGKSSEPGEQSEISSVAVVVEESTDKPLAEDCGKKDLEAGSDTAPTLEGGSD